MDITQEYLQEHYTYKNGFLYYKKHFHAVKHGLIVKGHIDNNGYRIVSIKNRHRKYHRMIFLYHHGYLPDRLDHINCFKTDNNIKNLRPITLSLNRMNTSKVKSSSGYRGVSWHKVHGQYIASIKYNSKGYHLGYFHDKNCAARAYNKKALEFYGDGPWINIIGEEL